MTQPRVPYWFTLDHRAALADAIVNLTATTTVFPTVREHLDAVLTELGVVEARDQIWPATAAVVRRATGYGPEVLPIRMSDDEVNAVLTLPLLPRSVRAALTGKNQQN